jgi:hypothetical protein
MKRYVNNLGDVGVDLPGIGRAVSAGVLPPCVQLINGILRYTGGNNGTLHALDNPDPRLKAKQTTAPTVQQMQVVPLDVGTARETWNVYSLNKWYHIAGCGVYNELPHQAEQPAQPQFTLPPCIKLVNGSYVYEPRVLNAAPGVGIYPVSTINGGQSHSKAPNPFLSVGTPLNDLTGDIGGVAGALAGSTSTGGVMGAISASTPARVTNQGTADEVWYAFINGEWVKLIACKPEIKVVDKVVVPDTTTPARNYPAPPTCVEITTAPWHGIYTDPAGNKFSADANKDYNGKKDTWHYFTNNEWIELINCGIIDKPVEKLPPCIQLIGGKYYYADGVGGKMYEARKAEISNVPVNVANRIQNAIGGSPTKWYALIDGAWIELVNCKPLFEPIIEPVKPQPEIPVVRQPDPIYPSPVVRQPDPVYPSPVVRQPDPVYPSQVVQPTPEPEDDCDCEVKKLSMPKMVIYDYPKKDNCCNGEFY